MFSNLRSSNRVALRSVRPASAPRVSFSSRARRSQWRASSGQVIHNTTTTPRTNFFGPQWVTTNASHQCLQQCQYQDQPRSQKWARASAYFVALSTLYSLVLYASNYGHEVPLVGRKWFKFDKSEYPEDYRYNREIHKAMVVLELAQSHYPESIWPEDHPNTMATKRIFKQLLEANGMQDQNWEIHVLNAPASGGVHVTLDRKLVISSGIFTFCQDEAELATILASGLAAAVAEHTLEKHSRATLSRLGCLDSLQLLVTSIFMKQLWYISIPYSVVFGAFLHRQQKLYNYTVPEEQDHIMLRLLHQAGHDIRRIPAFFTQIARAKELVYNQYHSIKRFMNFQQLSNLEDRKWLIEILRNRRIPRMEGLISQIRGQGNSDDTPQDSRPLLQQGALPDVEKTWEL